MCYRNITGIKNITILFYSQALFNHSKNYTLHFFHIPLLYVYIDPLLNGINVKRDLKQCFG